MDDTFLLTDLDQRRPVWEALSTLFLDTDVSLLRGHRAELLAASIYTLAELEHILIDEVYPVCRANLLNIAGEWAGFDPEWLEGRIRRRISSPFRRFHRINLGRLTVPTSEEWRQTKASIQTIRSGGALMDVN